MWKGGSKALKKPSKIMILLSMEGQVHKLIMVRLLDCVCLYVGFGFFFHEQELLFPLVNEQSVGGRLRVKYLSESSKIIRVKWK